MMARAYSLDLRRRVVEAIDGGLSSREAARRFAIGIATAGSWHRLWRKTGDVRFASDVCTSLSRLAVNLTPALSAAPTSLAVTVL